jgi:LytS/YehU family sensor histidine kinase
MQIIEHEYEAEVRELQHSVFLAVRWFEKYKFNLLNVTKKKVRGTGNDSRQITKRLCKYVRDQVLACEQRKSRRHVEEARRIFWELRRNSTT